MSSQESAAQAAHWTLTDTQADIHVDALNVAPEDAGGVGFTKRTLHGGLQEGVELLCLENGTLSVDLLPTRGMGIWKIRTQDQRTVGWESPVPGPVHPSLVPLSEPSGLGWLHGFDELLARCGLESNGAPEFDADGRLLYALHGRIANRPASHLSVQIDSQRPSITATGQVEESRFHFPSWRLTSTYSLDANRPMLRISDSVENLSGREAEFQLLYHINLGSPILEEGAQLLAPVHTLVPRNQRAADGVHQWNQYQRPTVGFEEQVYFLQLVADQDGRTGVMLKNRDASGGLALGFETTHLPCFTLWKNTVAQADGYVTGLEPGTNFPNPRSFEGSQQRVVRLQPGASCRFELQLEVLLDRQAVVRAEQAITRLQTGHTEIFDAPQPGWCADL